MKKIEEEFECIGFFGFGNGISIERKQLPHCNNCILASKCWGLHRERAKRFFPDLAERIDNLGKEKDGADKIAELIKAGGADPYMSMMLGNMEDGMLVEKGLQVKDRKEFTLKYPFKKQ